VKENKYDQENFFSQYAEMERSKFGLEAAGEWHILKELLPDFTNKSVLDLGCGYGWHCLYANEQGAKQVIGVDISEKMLKVAREKAKDFSTISYEQKAMEDIAFGEDQFDVVISSLAFHYVDDFSSVVKKIANWMKDGGQFVFSVEHPIFTSREEQDWIYNEKNEPKCWAVDDYHQETFRQTNFLGEIVTKYHRTVSTYLNCLIDNGFQLTKLEESYPSEEALKENEYAKHELRRPMFLLVLVKKVGK
jgi:2-polyprenyl-3-methyl-5-hydroxy-6-metoxy-1,4-benzoquinol methylase